MQRKEQLNQLGIHESWHDVLFPLMHTPSMYKIIEEYHKRDCYPEKHLIFKVFSMPVDNIKVVLLGQDPYYDGSAIGLAFAVKQETKTPYSLRIIFESIQEEYKINQEIPKDLSIWVEQGVFLLNTALTVEKGKPESFLELWKPFSEAVIKHLAKTVNPVWLLLGKSAQRHKKFIIDMNQNSRIIERNHPASVRYGYSFEPFVNEVTKYTDIKWI